MRSLAILTLPNFTRLSFPPPPKKQIQDLMHMYPKKISFKEAQLCSLKKPLFTLGTSNFHSDKAVLGGCPPRSLFMPGIASYSAISRDFPNYRPKPFSQPQFSTNWIVLCELLETTSLSWYWKHAAPRCSTKNIGTRLKSTL